MPRANTMLSSTAYAALHGVTRARVRQWALAGRLPGARHAGRDWRIPCDCPRPQDTRCKAYREEMGK